MSPEDVAGPQKRVPLSMKIAPDLRSRLLSAAQSNGRTLTQEAELRLAQSFELADKSVAVLTEFLGGKENAGVVKLIANALIEVSESEGIHWSDPKADLAPYGMDLRDILSTYRARNNSGRRGREIMARLLLGSTETGDMPQAHGDTEQGATRNHD